MGLREWLNPYTPVVAAAATVAEPRELDSLFNSSARTTAEVWKIWRQVGEIHYATTQQARLVSRVEWDVVLDGEQLEREQADELLAAAFGNQLPDLTQQAALHLQVAGGYILAKLATGWWEVVSLSPDHKIKAKLKNAEVLVTVSNPDPSDPGRPDSPVIAAMDVATELLLARAQARAASRNRTAQTGILLYPQEGAGTDPEGFKKKLMDVITAPLADERSAASVTPNLVGFPAEMIEKWKVLDVAGPIDEKLSKRIESLVQQIAMILDSPPQILLGMGDVNHWSAWAIQEDNWLGHTEPYARLVGTGFALALAQAADLDPEIIEVTPDPAPLLKRRPAFGDVMAAHAAGVVSDDYVRAQLGADDDDAPDAEPEEEEPPAEEVTTDEPQEVAQGGQPVPIAAAARPPFNTKRLIEIDQQALEATIDLAEIGVTRVLERVGAQLRARAQGDEAAKAALAGISNEELPAKLGVSDLPGLDQTITDTLTSVLPRRWSTLVARTYAKIRSAGLDVSVDEDDLTRSIDTFVSAISAVARIALDGKPTKADTWVAAQRAMAVAGGGADPSPPVVAAWGIPRPIGIGIALGSKVLIHIAQNFGLVARQFRWVYGTDPRSQPHPIHETLDGVPFDGEAYIENNIRWYPGDHAGCLCGVEPIWEPA